MATDAERLRAAGHKVTLADGEQVLVFDFEACMLLEQRFGGLPEVNRRLKFSGDTAMADVLGFLIAGLTHTGMDEDEVRSQVLVGELANYAAAIDAAITEAFPEPNKGKARERGRAKRPSSGTSSTTSPPSPTAEALSSSGG